MWKDPALLHIHEDTESVAEKRLVVSWMPDARAGIALYKPESAHAIECCLPDQNIPNLAARFNLPKVSA